MKSGVSSAQREQMRRATVAHFGNVFAEVERFFNPPPPTTEPEIETVYIAEGEQGTARLSTPASLVVIAALTFLAAKVRSH